MMNWWARRSSCEKKCYAVTGLMEHCGVLFRATICMAISLGRDDDMREMKSIMVLVNRHCVFSMRGLSDGCVLLLLRFTLTLALDLECYGEAPSFCKLIN